MFVNFISSDKKQVKNDATKSQYVKTKKHKISLKKLSTVQLDNLQVPSHKRNSTGNYLK